MAARTLLPDHRYQVDATDAANPTLRRSYRERFKSYSAALDRATEFVSTIAGGQCFAVTIIDRHLPTAEQVLYSV